MNSNCIYKNLQVGGGGGGGGGRKRASFLLQMFFFSRWNFLQPFDLGDEKQGDARTGDSQKTIPQSARAFKLPRIQIVNVFRNKGS